MKKLVLFILSCLIAFPIFAQTKEEQEAQQQALYELAKEAIEAKDWSIVPYEVGNSSSTDKAIFLAYEKGQQMLIQGVEVCGNSHTNIVEVKDYKVKYNKKGDITLSFRVLGRKLKGSYTIRIKNGSNDASVSFTPAGNKGSVAGFTEGQQKIAAGANEDTGDGEYKRFRGPLLKANQSGYYQKSSPI